MAANAKAFLFQKHLNKSTCQINSDFGIITHILNISQEEFAVYGNKSKCLQIQVHFHFAPTQNAVALVRPTLRFARRMRLFGFMLLLCNYVLQ